MEETDNIIGGGGEPKYPIGTTFEEYFEGYERWYKGKVVRYLYHKKGGSKIRMCEILYEEDGDIQDLYESEICEYEKKRKIRKLMKPTDAASDAANNDGNSSTNNAIEVKKQESSHVVKNNNEAIVAVPDNVSSGGRRNNPIIIDIDSDDGDDFNVPPKQEDAPTTIIIDDDSMMPKREENTNNINNNIKTESDDVITTTERNPGLIPAAATPISPERQQQNSTNPTTTAAADTVPIKEETHKKFMAKRKECYRKYGDRFLLQRQDISKDKKGIARLGGSQQSTFAYPASDNALLQDLSYPTPNHLGESNDGSVCKYDYGYCTFNTTWQTNGPMFAGQETASFDWLPDHFKEPGRPSFPVFMKRTMTKLDSESQGALLGWEYVGNYRSIHDEEVPFWESANNFTKASKKEIAKKTFDSSHNENGYGRRRLDAWRDRLIRALEDETDPREEHGFAARCLQLGFRPDIPDKELSELVVNLDEYHKQYMVKFDRYDERIYEWCVGGKTNKTKDGKDLSKAGTYAIPAKAQDWYDFAETYRLFKY